MNPIARCRWWITRDGYRGDGPAAYAARKPALFAGLAGAVLELGPGRGRNLRLLPVAVTGWTGVEPNPYLHEPLREAAGRWSDRTGRPARVVAGPAEVLPVPDGSVDAVLSTFVLCSVRDLDRTLAEVIRVLRPGGRLVLLEHVAPRPGVARLVARLAAPVSRLVDAGCDPARDTGGGLRRAGFAALDLTGFDVPAFAGLAVPHLAGTATTRSATTAAGAVCVAG